MKNLDRKTISKIGLLICRVLVMASVVGAVVVVAATYVIDLSSMSRDDHVAWNSSLSLDATYVLLIQLGAGLIMLILLRLSNCQSVLLNVAGAVWLFIAIGSLAAIPIAYQAPDPLSRLIEMWAVRIHGLLVVSGICLLIHEWQVRRKAAVVAEYPKPSA